MIIAPRTFKTTKIVIKNRPIKAKSTGALLKLANAGTMPPFIETLATLPFSTIALVIVAPSALKLNKFAFLIPT